MKTLLIILLCHCSLLVFAQQQQPLSLRDSLFKKSRNQKTAAWVLLGVGGTATIIGLIIATNDAVNGLDAFFSLQHYDEPSSASPILIIGGIVSMAGSIPLFIASGRNYRSAMSLSMGTQKVMMPVKSGWTYQYQPAVLLKIPIGRR